MTFDLFVRAMVNSNLQMLVPFWLMATYAYDQLDAPIISDACFDELATMVIAAYPVLTHPHTSRIDVEACRSALGVVNGWPSIVSGAVQSLLDSPHLADPT